MAAAADLSCSPPGPRAWVRPTTVGHGEGDSGVSIEEQTTTGAVNWEAYSHDELYQMLWQDADVADVSAVATEWAQHRAALDTHAEVLREQRGGDAGRAGTARRRRRRHGGSTRWPPGWRRSANWPTRVSQAAQEAADALATARAMMPAPPTGAPPARWPSSAQLGRADPRRCPPSSSTRAGAYVRCSPPAPAVAFTAPRRGSDMGTAFSAVGSAGSSFYFGAATQDMQKAQAVQRDADLRVQADEQRPDDRRRAECDPAARRWPRAGGTGRRHAARAGCRGAELVGGAPGGGPRPR